MFDFVVATGSAVALVVRYSGGGSGGSFVAALRSFRLARIVRLVKSAKALREIFGTLYVRARAAPPFYNPQTYATAQRLGFLTNAFPYLLVTSVPHLHPPPLLLTI